MNRTALRTASQRAAAKAKADEDEAKKAAAKAETDEMESSEDDEDEDDETKASEDDCDTDDDAPNPPKKAKKATAKATTGASDHRAAEKARIKAIVTHGEAEGREDLAEHLAYDTSMTAKAAIAMLAKAPKGAVEAVETTAKGGRETFRAAMEATARGDGKVASGKGKGALKAVEDMSDDEYVASIVALSSPHGLTKA